MSSADREAFLADVRVGVLAITIPDRGPIAVPVWYDYRPGGTIRFTTGADSPKAAALRAAGRATICVQQEDLPYRYVSVEGPIVVDRGADIERDSRPIARRYLGDRAGDAYVAGTSGHSTLFELQPQRWSTVDYGA